MGKRRAAVRLLPDNVSDLENSDISYYEPTTTEPLLPKSPSAPKKFYKLKSSLTSCERKDYPNSNSRIDTDQSTFSEQQIPHKRAELINELKLTPHVEHSTFANNASENDANCAETSTLVDAPSKFESQNGYDENKLNQEINQLEGEVEPADGETAEKQQSSDTHTKFEQESVEQENAPIGQEASASAEKNMSQSCLAEGTLKESSTTSSENITSNESTATSEQTFFGNLFNCPFTNPFHKAASCKADSGFNLTATQQIHNSEDSANLQMYSDSTKEEVQDEEENADTKTTLPQHFSGEENDLELFRENSVVLFKRITIKSDDTNNAEETMKFKKQGQGILRVLKNDQAPENVRLVIRQKGTWSLLLNTPISLMTKYELMEDSRYYIKFVGLDTQKKQFDHSTACVSCLLLEVPRGYTKTQFHSNN